jgi:5-bromo-4-chloroindolyl phosphate hydrolysis protein
LAKQGHASDILREFGANKVMMLDGGRSTQLVCQKNRLVSWTSDWRKERTLPQTIATVAANPQDWYQKNKFEGWLKDLNREIERITEILEEVEQTVQSIRDLYNKLSDTEQLVQDLVESLIQNCSMQIIIVSSIGFTFGFFLSKSKRKRN